MDEADTDFFESERKKYFAAISDQVFEAVKAVQEAAALVRDSQSRGNTQTIIHKTQGMGNWGAAAVTACFCTLIFMVLAAIVVIPDLHDLRAWQDINRKDIARIQAFIQQEKQK